MSARGRWPLLPKMQLPVNNLPRHQMIASVTEFCPNPDRILRRVLSRGLRRMASKRTEIVIEKIIESCDGNTHGALEALLLVNEHLEAELHRLYAVISRIGSVDECLKTMH